LIENVMAFYTGEFVIIVAKIHPEFVMHNFKYTGDRQQESVRGFVAKFISHYTTPRCALPLFETTRFGIQCY